MTRAVARSPPPAGALAAPGLVDLLVGLRAAPARPRGRAGVALLARLGRGFGARPPRGLRRGSRRPGSTRRSPT